MSPWERLLEKPHARGHVVQLYPEGDEVSLVANVSLYLSEGLKRGEGVLVVAAAAHRESFARELDRLGVDTGSAIQTSQLVCIDARETLSQFMTAGQPDWDKFEIAMGTAMRAVRSAGDRPGLRAYGEMVGLLWTKGQYSAAIRLEQFWNKLLARSSFSLYCAYPIDVFDKKFHAAALDGVLCAHTHLMPAETSGNLETAVSLAMDEVLGAKADTFRNLIIQENQRSSWAVMPKGETAILWLRRNLPEQAERIVARAREYYRRSVQLTCPVFANE